MADALAPPKAGQASPFLTSFSTADKSLSLLRDLDRQQGQGQTGGGPSPFANLPPAVRVLVQNNSGSDLPCFRVLALTGILGSIADSDNGSTAFARLPRFTGATPSATTDAFCILEEPAPYIAGGLSPLAKAVVQGVVPVDVNITDAAHSYATPTASDNTKLTSATSGPARILYKPAGTGVMRCVVKLDESAATGGGSAGDFAWDSGSYTITSGTWSDTGVSVTIPVTGTYLIVAQVNASVATSAGTGTILARLTDGYGAGDSLSERYIASGTNAAAIGHIITVNNFTASDVVKLQAARIEDVSITYTTSALNNYTSQFGKTNIFYLRIA